MIIIEIILTVTAWRNGWTWRALLPMGLCLAYGFTLGLSMGAQGLSMDGLLLPALLGDLTAIVSLIVMTVKAPRAEREHHAPVAESPSSHHTEVSGEILGAASRTAG
jgi:hypothetical protein